MNEMQLTMDDAEALSRILWVLNRTTVTPAPWDSEVLVVDASAAYPADSFYPTGVALRRLPGEDRWWDPDSDFVAEDRADGGFSLAEALVTRAGVTVQCAAIDRMRGHSDWWDSMAGDWWLR